MAQNKVKNKVLFLITKATYGGAQRYVYDLAVATSVRGIETHLAYGVDGRIETSLRERGIAVHQIKSLARDIGILKDIRAFFEMYSCIQRIHPSVVHINSSKAAGLGALAARLLGVPRIIFTVHGWPFKEDRSTLMRAFIYLASWLTGMLAHHVIVVSKTDKALGESMWWVRKKIVHIPLGRERISFQEPNEGFRKMCGDLAIPPLKPNTIRIVSIAELTPNKGLRYAIDAVAELVERGVDAIFVNPGDGEERNALESEARRRGVGDRVFLPRFVQNAAENLRGFDVFVLPSVKEGLPYVLMEALMAGIPIVATDIVKDDFAAYPSVSFIAPRDPRALADAIERVARRGRSDLQSDLFPLERMIEKTLALY